MITEDTEFTELYDLVAALDCAPVVLILNQIHMLGRKSDTQEGTKWEGGCSCQNLNTDCCLYRSSSEC